MAREALLLDVLGQLERWYPAFRADPDPARTGLLDAYRSLCATLGQPVRVELPGRPRADRDGRRTSTADGRLLVAPAGGAAPRPVSAGDVIHLRS